MAKTVTLKPDLKNDILSSSKDKPPMDGKVLLILLEQMNKDGAKRNFEKITTLLGLNKQQYLAIQDFEKYYISRKNSGVEATQKNKDLLMVKNLFACWDQKRLGHISMDTLAENLISFGLSMSKA